jgi:glutathione S-transferase
MQLYIGNKNYSSWSLRPWLLMRQAGIPFEERRLSLDFSPGSTFRQTIAAVSPAGRVPVLVDDDGFAVWDTLAIVEYLAEKFPDRSIWPAAQRERARARSLCAEMHGGFGALRQHCPMNLEAALPEVGARLVAEQPAVAADLARLEQMWREQLRDSGGPFLFGAFGAADAFYAPVCTRIRTYGLPMAGDAAGYVERVLAVPAMQQWHAQALAEHEWIADDEPYRQRV